MGEVNQAVTKALDILDLLGQVNQGVRLKDLADRLSIPESTAHRLLTSLVERSYAQQSPEHGTYHLGWKLVILARSMESDARLIHTMRPFLEALVQTVGQTTNLAVLSNDQVLYLDCYTPSDSLSLYMKPGVTLPPHATSLGKVLMAYLPDPARASLVRRIDMKPLTNRTITDRELLSRSLDEIRLRGFALDHGELRAEVNCVAAPLIDDNGMARAAISVTAPNAGLPAGWEQSYPRIVMETAQKAAAVLFQVRSPA